MITAFGGHIQELPSYRRLMRRLRDCLVEGRSLVVVLPDPLDEDDLWLGLSEELRLRDMTAERLDLEEVGGEEDPARTLTKLLAPPTEEGQISDVQDLLRSTWLPDVLALRGVDSLPAGAQRGWLDLVRNWSQASQGLAGDGSRCALTLALRPSRLRAPLPKADVRLRIEYWLGAPTVEELQHLARHGGGDPPPERLWRETMVLAYAGEDVELAEMLLTAPISGPEWPTPTLERYARNRGWAADQDPEEVLRVVAGLRKKPVSGHVLHEIPAAALAPWSQGLLNWNLWSGWELHSAWLALHGPEHLLRHRLWRAQASLLLPLVDRLRLAVCAWINQRFDEDWPLRWSDPKDPNERQAVAEDPFACQWGHLVEVIKAPELRELHPMQQTARVARDIRNSLSHQRCVPLSEFRALWRGYQEGVARLAERGDYLAG